MCIRDMEPIRHSRYVDDCCCLLTKTAQSPTDLTLCHLVRLHGLAQKVVRTFVRDDGYTTGLSTASTIACVKALEMDLFQMGETIASISHEQGELSDMRAVLEVTDDSASVPSLPCCGSPLV